MEEEQIDREGVYNPIILVSLFRKMIFYTLNLKNIKIDGTDDDGGMIIRE